MSTKCSEAEISCRMSTIATRWSRSRCSSLTRARRRATSSSLPSESGVGDRWGWDVGDWFGGIAYVASGVFSIFCRDVLVELVAVEPYDAVAACLLRHIQRIVRGPHETFAVPNARVGPSGHTETRRTADRDILECECMCLDVFSHPFRERDSGIQHSARQQQHELLATVPTRPIDLAHFFAQNARELLQH